MAVSGTQWKIRVIIKICVIRVQNPKVDGWISAYKAESLPSGNRRLFLRTEGRGGVRGELAVEMDTKTLRFSSLSASEIEHSKAKAATDEWAEKIARAIEDYSGKATVKQIAEIVERPHNTVNRHVQRLTASGFLEVLDERFAPHNGGPAAALYRVAYSHSHSHAFSIV